MRKIHRYLPLLPILLLAAAAHAEQIDNPEYTQWARYKPGTYVTMQQTTDMGAMAMPTGMPPGMNMADMMPKISITTKLTEVKPDALTLEVTTTTTQMGQSQDRKTTRSVPAKIEKPVAPTTAATQSIELSDLKEGQETLEIKGRKIETSWREYTSNAAAPDDTGRGRGRGRGTTATAPASGKTHTKIWSSPDVPGTTVKTETTTTMDQMGDVKSSMTVVDFDIIK
jgi:hypothetical protein